MAERVLLLTGFGPFPGVTDNPTAAVVRALDGLRLGEVRVRSAVLPVAHPAAAEAVAAQWRMDAAEAVVHLGVAAGADTVRVERQARNDLSFRVPDVAGAQPQATPMVPDLPLDAVLRAPWPLEPLVAALLQAGLPATASDDAGRYVCNATYWASLHAGLRAVFVHVPPAGTVAPDGGVWTLARLTEAGRVAADWIARR